MLHLNVHGSLALCMVIVLVLNIALLGFDSSVSTGNMLLSLEFVSSGRSPFGVDFVASGNSVLDSFLVVSVNTAFITGIASGIIGVAESFVASGSVLSSMLVSPVRRDFVTGSVAADNEPSFCHLFCLFALLFLIKHCVAILLADG